MQLTTLEAGLFFKLWLELLWGINEKKEIVPRFKKPVYGKFIDQGPLIEIRHKLWEHPEWIGEFLSENDNGEFTEEERGILASWQNSFIEGTFFIVKHLKKYSVFMDENGDRLYGVIGISNPVSETVPMKAPFMVNAVLLPFKDRIIYDSFLLPYNITFGRGMAESVKEQYAEAQTRGIIESMDGNSQLQITPPTEKKPRAAAKKELGKDKLPPIIKQAKIPVAHAEKYLAVSELIEKVCAEKLNGEYKDLCIHTLQKLCRKRSSPMSRGRVSTWAAGIIYAIGSVNFLFDKETEPYLSAADIGEYFGISKSTAANKAAEIKNILNIDFLQPEYTLDSIYEKMAVPMRMLHGLKKFRQSPPGVMKMSEMLLEILSPWLDGIYLEDLAPIAVHAWNECTGGQPIITKKFLKKSDEIRSMVEEMKKRKQELFPDDERVITTFEVYYKGEEPILRVASEYKYTP